MPNVAMYTQRPYGVDQASIYQPTELLVLLRKELPQTLGARNRPRKGYAFGVTRHWVYIVSKQDAQL